MKSGIILSTVEHDRGFNVVAIAITKQSAAHWRNMREGCIRLTLLQRFLPIPPAKYVHQCAECEYGTKQKGHFDRHRFFHDEKSAHQCPHCSFSVRSMTNLTIHVKRYYTKTDRKALVNKKHLKKLHYRQLDEHNNNNKNGNQLVKSFLYRFNHMDYLI